jgi:hypothetical protein
VGRRVPIRAGSGVMTMHGDLAIAGIQWSDLAAISERVVIL